MPGNLTVKIPALCVKPRRRDLTARNLLGEALWISEVRVALRLDSRYHLPTSGLSPAVAVY